MDFFRKLFVFLILIHSVTCYQPLFNCTDDNGNYTQGSIYSVNLNTALKSLLSSVNGTSPYNYYYYNTSYQDSIISAFVMCRADLSLDTCKKCTQDAITEVLNLCPNEKQAVYWKADSCVLSYANYSQYGRSKVDYGWFLPTNVRNSSNPLQFKEGLSNLFDDLRSRAIIISSSKSNGGDQSMKVAVGNVSGPDFEKVIGMAQCRPDLSSEDCNNCLVKVANDLLSKPNCGGFVGCMLLQGSCFVRYDTSPFYNGTRMLELLMPPPQSAAPPQTVLPPPPSPGHGTPTIAIAAPISGLLVVVLIVFVGWIIFKKKRANQKQRSMDENNQSGDEDSSTFESLQYDFGKITSATNNFSNENKLGEGGFGAVYKGRLQNGKEIAVKKLSKNSTQGDLEFKNEVLLLARLQHRNLVRLLGFSLEGAEKLLVYEYVQNASLDQFIFDPVKRSQLDWEMRSKIIGGVARGLLYLHEDSRLRIIHRDLKAGNVLLDGEMNPKIADFGTARLFEQDDQTQSTSKVVGTYGYMAPEYVLHGKFSIKSDVFSFGVLLLEILSGQRNNCSQYDGTQDLLISFAWKNWKEGKASNIIDPILKSPSGSTVRDMLRCVHIGLLCVQENAADRPTMASVVLMLSSVSFTLAIPSEPPAYLLRGYELETNSTIITRSVSDQKKMLLNTSSSSDKSVLSKNY